MEEINLHDYYPEFYATNSVIFVPDKLAAQLRQWSRDERAYERQRYRCKAYFSIDCNDGILHEILIKSPTPEEIYERKMANHLLHTAILILPEKQSKRIYAHYFLGMSKAAIARAEGVSRTTIRDSIAHALRTLEVFMVKFC